MMNRKLFCAFVCALGVLAACGQAWAHPGGVDAPSPDLPPIVPDNEYLSPSDVHARYSGPALEIVLSMIEHQPFAGMPVPPDPAGERHHFESELRGLVSVNNGPFQPILMTGPVDTVAYGRAPGQLGTFDTEMLSMSLTGGPIMVRESPTKASTGKTSIADIGGGLYHIDSFFDVFTELSIDGGMTWMPSNVDPSGQSHPTRVHLGGIPEPTSLVLVGLAIAGLAAMGRRAV